MGYSGEEGLSQKPCMSLILNCESGVNNITAKKLPCPLQSAATQVMDFHMVSSYSTVMEDMGLAYLVLFLVKISKIVLYF